MKNQIEKPAQSPTPSIEDVLRAVQNPSNSIQAWAQLKELAALRAVVNAADGIVATYYKEKSPRWFALKSALEAVAALRTNTQPVLTTEK